MSRQVEFFFDYGSPFSYLADTQLGALAGRCGAEVIYRPMLLGAVFKATGNASPVTVAAKGRYLGIELQRWAARYGIAMKMNPFFPINTLSLMRGAVASRKLGAFAAYHATMFGAVWEQQLNVGDDGVFRHVLQRAGLDAAALCAAAEQPEVKDELRANTDEAVRRGVFGAPTLFVGEEMFWGNDRLQFVEEALARRS